MIEQSNTSEPSADFGVPLNLDPYTHQLPEEPPAWLDSYYDEECNPVPDPPAYVTDLYNDDLWQPAPAASTMPDRPTEPPTKKPPMSIRFIDESGATTETPEMEPLKASVPINELFPKTSCSRGEVLEWLDGTLEDLHRNGSELHANCPNCGHTRNPDAKNKADRFFSTQRTNYQFWTCRQCDYKTTTNQLLGRPSGARPQRPIVKEWKKEGRDRQDRIKDIRTVYKEFADFCQIHIDKISEHLRGVPMEVARALQIGYIDKSLYLEFYRGLTPELKEAAKLGGLPEVKEDGHNLGAGWAMVSGHKGKIVFVYHDLNGEVCDIRTRSISDKDTMRGKQVRYMGPRGSYELRGAELPYVTSTDSSIILFTEGEFKALIPTAKGSTYPVYGLRGTSEPLEPMLDYFNNKTVILAFDNDDAGAVATVRQGEALRAKGISVLVLNPSNLGKHKGIDDFVNAEGIDLFNKLLEPANLLTLPEYRQMVDPKLIENLTNPKGDIGVEKKWMPKDHIDQFAHPNIDDAISPDQATDQLKEKLTDFIEGWQKGNGQFFTDLPAGTGKTTATLEVAKKKVIETEHGTVSVFIPNHGQIDEKIAEGTLEGFKHIYGRRWEDKEDGIKNCHYADTASTMTQLGYNVSQTICPSCEKLNWCREEGYKAQFKGKANRAYSHGHLFTDYAEGSDLAVIDEANHRGFIQSTKIYVGNFLQCLQKGIGNQAQRELLESLVMLMGVPSIEGLTNIIFYTVLQRFYPELINALDQWGDGNAVQETLFDMALGYIEADNRRHYEIEHLPPAFAEPLFQVMSEDVRRIAQGQQPTGRIKLVDAGSHRYIEIITSKKLPDWYYKTPTILLNATANESIMQELYSVEGQLDVYSPTVDIAEGNEIIQDISRNNAKSGLVGTGDRTKGQRATWFEDTRNHIATHDESDVTLISVSKTEKYLEEEFPQAKTDHYGALEGKNNLQSGLMILANPPAVNLTAIQDEARALWPDIDTTLTRKSIAYNEIKNEDGHYLAIEQIDAVDPRLSALIDQHRDALAIQAIGRARLVRNSGRKVVIMFSRPIPGVKPTKVIYTREDKGEYRKNQTLDRLIHAAAEMLEQRDSFSVSTLADKARAAQRTVNNYWDVVISALGVQDKEMPFFQIMKEGGKRAVKVKLAVNDEGIAKLKEFMQESKDHCMINSLYIYNIANGSYSDLAIPDGFALDIETVYRELGRELPKPTTPLIKEEAPAPATPPMKKSSMPATPEPKERYILVSGHGVFNDKDIGVVTAPEDGRRRLIIAGIGIIDPRETPISVVPKPPSYRPKPEPVTKPSYRQIARRTFASPELAQQTAERIRRGGLYNVTVNGCTMDRQHKSGFDISHLVDEYTEVLEVAM